MLAWHRSRWCGSRLPRSRSPAPRRRRALTRTRWAGSRVKPRRKACPCRPSTICTSTRWTLTRHSTGGTPSGRQARSPRWVGSPRSRATGCTCCIPRSTPRLQAPSSRVSIGRSRRAPFGLPGPTRMGRRSTNGSRHSTPRVTGSNFYLSTPGRTIPRECRTPASARSAISCVRSKRSRH